MITKFNLRNGMLVSWVHRYSHHWNITLHNVIDTSQQEKLIKHKTQQNIAKIQLKYNGRRWPWKRTLERRNSSDIKIMKWYFLLLSFNLIIDQWPTQEDLNSTIAHACEELVKLRTIFSQSTARLCLSTWNWTEHTMMTGDTKSCSFLSN